MIERSILLSAALFIVLGCDSGSIPVAPSGGSLTVRAIPQTITVDGSSTIEIFATNGGFPVRAGTEIRVTTDLGRILQELIQTDADGFAQTTLEADGRRGTANVSVRSGTLTGSTTVDIGDTSLQADFSCEVSEMTAIFTDDSAGGPTAWSWDFGDGGASSEQNPIHAYEEDGQYVVTLTVSNQGDQNSTSKFLTVPETGTSACQ